MNSQRKGKAYEREVANFLSSLGLGKFIRTPQSGGYVGGKNKIRTQELQDEVLRKFKGDIIPPPSIPIVIECKSHAPKRFNIKTLLTQNTLIDNWLQNLQDETNYLLFLKLTRIGQLIFFPSHLAPQTSTPYLLYKTAKTAPHYVYEITHFKNDPTPLKQLLLKLSNET